MDANVNFPPTYQNEYNRLAVLAGDQATVDFINASLEMDVENANAGWHATAQRDRERGHPEETPAKPARIPKRVVVLSTGVEEYWTPAGWPLRIGVSPDQYVGEACPDLEPLPPVPVVTPGMFGKKLPNGDYDCPVSEPTPAGSTAIGPDGKTYTKIRCGGFWSKWVLVP